MTDTKPNNTACGELALPSPTIVPLPMPHMMLSDFEDGDGYPVFNRNDMHDFARAYARAALAQQAAPGVPTMSALEALEIKYGMMKTAYETELANLRRASQPATTARHIEGLKKLVSAYGPKSLQYDIEHPNDGLNSTDPKEVERTMRGGTTTASAPQGKAWDDLVSAHELRLRSAQQSAEQAAHAGGDEADFAALLPGTYYMDPPDGGDVTVLEQVARMAKDAARYRGLREGFEDAIDAAMIILERNPVPR